MCNKENVQRFVEAQQVNFDTALSELKAGKKTSHWMWYIFPQIKGLGKSEISKYYAIQNIEEARAYLNNEYLSHNMNELLDVLLKQNTSNPTDIFGKPDDMNLKSSMTLFALADKNNEKYKKVLEKYFSGDFDKRTINIINKSEAVARLFDI